MGGAVPRCIVNGLADKVMKDLVYGLDKFYYKNKKAFN